MRRAVLPLLAVVLLTACGLAKDEDASAPTLAAARQARTPVLLPTLRLRSGHADGSVSATAQPTLDLVCADAIAWDQAEQRVGQQATVQGPVVGTHFAEESRGQPTFLNIGNPFPDPNRLTVVIWIEDRAAFPEPPETAYDGKTVCVTGVIETYEGVPEIVAASPSVIAIVEAR